MPVYRFAGFWRRFVAYFIDSLIIGVIFFVLFMVGVIAFFVGAASGQGSGLMERLSDPVTLTSATILMWIFGLAVNISYFTYFHGATGRTPGKMLLGLQVISADGKPITFGIAFLRAVGYLVSGAIFNLGFIWVAFDKRKQGWHDKIAATAVIIREEQTQAAGISIPDALVVSPDAGAPDQPVYRVDEQAEMPENNK
ncbi:MAG TPA: RDD family protein [Deltaproteobacteria bacterium]|nr:RDD family protein [Deltaproteobacteria bacterium]